MSPVNELDHIATKVKDRNRLIRVVIATVATVAVVNGMVGGWTALTGRTLFVNEDADGGLPLSWLPIVEASTLAQGATGDLRDADLWLRIGAGFPLILEALTIATATALLLRTLRSVARSEPFSPAAVSGLRRLAIVLLSGSAAVGLLSTAATIYLTINAGPVTGSDRTAFLGANYSGLTIGLPHWPVPLIIGGLVAAALLAAFRSGAQLMNDVDGVI